jgi:hypothetical protein
MARRELVKDKIIGGRYSVTNAAMTLARLTKAFKSQVPVGSIGGIWQ